MNYVFVLCCLIFSISNATEKRNVSVILNPESYSFSRMRTLETWISADILKDPASNIPRLQQRLCQISIEQPYARLHCEKIIGNPEDEDEFGSTTFPAIPAIQLPMLQFVHNKALERPLKFLEIGSGNDFVLSSLPYAMTGEIWCCERSLPMLEKITRSFNDNMNLKLKERCTFKPIYSDCFDLLKKYPNLSGTFDVICVQNVEHLFSIKNHEAFVTLVESLLAPGGQAFSAANSLLNEYALADHPVFVTYQKMKGKQKYPLFLAIGHTFKARVTVKGGKLEDGSVSVDPITHGDNKVTSAERPSDLGAWFDDVRVPANAKDGDIVDVTFVRTENFFTPQIYRDAYKDCSSLTVLEAFFIDRNGKRQEKYERKLDILFAAAIVKKNEAENKYNLEQSGQVDFPHR